MTVERNSFGMLKRPVSQRGRESEESVGATKTVEHVPDDVEEPPLPSNLISSETNFREQPQLNIMVTNTGMEVEQLQNPPRLSRPGAFPVGGADANNDDASWDLSFRSNDSSDQLDDDDNEVVVPTATLVTEDTRPHLFYHGPVVFAERGIRSINFKDRRVRIGLLLTFLAFIGLIAALVISQTSNEGGSNGQVINDKQTQSQHDSDTQSPSPGNDETPSSTPTVALSLSWEQIGDHLDFDYRDPDDRPGPPAFLSGDGQRLAVGAEKYFLGIEAAYTTLSIFQLQDRSWDIIGSELGSSTYHLFDNNLAAISGNGMRVAISSPHEGNNNTGYVAVLEIQNDGTWTRAGDFIVGEGSGDRFGWSVSLSADGKFIAIGAYLNDGNGQDCGSAQVFEFAGDEWIQRGNTIYGAAAYARTGYYVEISDNGTRVAVGSNVLNYDGGQIRVFEFNSTSWNQIGQAFDGAVVDFPDEMYGDAAVTISLSADGNTLAVGLSDFFFGPLDGQVRVYRYDGDENEWALKGNVIYGPNRTMDVIFGAYFLFGTSVSLSSDGNCIAIGAPRARNELGSETGQATVFRFEPVDSSWERIGDFINGESGGDEAGSFISLSSDCKIVAVSSEGSGGRNGKAHGLVRVFELVSA